MSQYNHKGREHFLPFISNIKHHLEYHTFLQECSYCYNKLTINPLPIRIIENLPQQNSI